MTAAERIRDALSYIPSDDRDLWLRMGMAVKSELGEAGFHDWDTWSQQSESYDPTDIHDVWKSIGSGSGKQITAGTLFFEAKARGWQDSGTRHKPTEAEIAERNRQTLERQAQDQAEIEREQAQAGQNALALCNATKAATPDHPYLLRKGVAPTDTLREIEAADAAPILGYMPKSRGETLKGRLLVAPVKRDGTLSTVELIDGDGRKTALVGRGTKVAGYWATGDLDAGTILIGEGVATCLSAFHATGQPAVAALSSGNILAVAKIIRQRYPNSELVILADLVKKTGEPDPHAVEAAQAVCGLLAVPDFGSDRPEGFTDFNDLASRAGAGAVKASIEAARSPAKDDGAPAIATVTDEGRPRRQADILVDIGKDQYLFHDGDVPYAQVDGGTYAVQSDSYKEVLNRKYHRLTGKGAHRNSITDAINTLAAVAKYDGPNERVYLRVGEANGSIVLDAGTRNWDGYKITSASWRPVSSLPAKFRRAGPFQPYPVPTTADITRIWKYLNVATEHRPLVLGWLLAALNPTGPYPILLLVAEQGSGKSSATRILKELTDPSGSPLRAAPKNEQDLLVAAINSRVLALDNISGIDHATSDALCRLSTGGALSGRKLYTDTDETLIEVQCPVILNGIDDIASRPDLAERCLHVTLNQITNRRPERELAEEFKQDAGAIFAALLDGLVMARKRAESLDIGPLPRMADFAKWAAAGMPALGFSEAQFIEAYRENQAQVVEAGLESSPVGQAIRKLMDARDEPWEGPSDALLKAISEIAQVDVTSRAWPRSAKGLMNTMRRLAPALRHVGITWHQRRTSKQNLFVLCKEPGQAPFLHKPTRGGGTMELMEHNQPACTNDVEVF